MPATPHIRDRRVAEMTDRAAIWAGMAGAIFAALCCAAPLLVASLSLAGVATWLMGAGPVALALTVIGVGLIAWAIRHRGTREASARQTPTAKV